MKNFFGNIILEYLKFWAKQKLEKIHPKIIGITGSVGKTSVIHGLHTVISPSHKTKTTLKGNSESGIPLEILGIRLKNYSLASWMHAIIRAPFCANIRETYDILIVEMGVDAPYAPKNMAHLLSIVKPDIGVFLNVAPVHTEQFQGGVGEIAKEKGLLITTLPLTGVGIVNSDDLEIQKVTAVSHSPLRTFGWNAKAMLRCTGYEITKTGTKFTYKRDGKQFSLIFPTQWYFKEYSMLFAAILLTAEEVGISLTDAKKRLEQSYRLPPGRLSVFTGEKGTTILDGSYNASPVAVASTLKLLKDIKSPGRKIVVLGDMRELGGLSEEKHKEVGVLVTQVADEIVLVGPMMKQYALPVVIASGFPKERVFHFDTARDVGQFLLTKRMQKQDMILVKGSQNTIFLEEVVYQLMKEKSQAKTLLCRQSPYWQNIRKRFFAKHKHL